MKKLFFISLLIFSIGSLKANINPLEEMKINLKINTVDTAGYPQSTLMAIDIASYANRPVNDFLAALDVAAPGYALSPVYGGHSMRLASRLNAYYLNGLAFVIVVTDFTHMQQFNSDSQWDVNLFRQEAISSIEFYKNDLCLSGCPD